MKGRNKVITYVGLVLILTVSFAWAQDKFPNKPIQIIFPYATGGVVELCTRIVVDKMQEFLGQPVVVVNKPGGATAVGVSYVTNSKPDGHTLLTISEGIMLITLTTPDLPYKLSDLTPIGSTVGFNYVVVAHRDVPVKNLAELVTYVKKNPNTLNYGSGAIGGNTYFMAELFKHNAQLVMQHIPYPGVTASLNALLGNHIQIGFLVSSDVLPHIRSGAIRGLAALSEKRDPLLPEVPTSVEQGFAELATASSFILFAPAKTPASVVKKLEDALGKALQDEKVREGIHKLLYRIEFHNSQYLQSYLDSEIKKWSHVLKELKFGVK